jgi:hypothetical protein
MEIIQESLNSSCILFATRDVFPDAVPQATKIINGHFLLAKFSVIYLFTVNNHSSKLKFICINYNVTICICFSQTRVILLPLGVLSINHICNKYGSTTSSNVASSSHRTDAKVFNHTGHHANLEYIASKYFLSR